MSIFEYGGWKSVVEMAEKKQDGGLLTRIRGHDLFACEAKFHRNSRMRYMQCSEKWRSTDLEVQQKQKGLEKSHLEAFDVICQLIERDVLDYHKILKLSDLRQTYLSCLAQTDFANPDYRRYKLKQKFEHHVPFQGKLSFCELGIVKSYILFSTEIDVNTALRLPLMGSTMALTAHGLLNSSGAPEHSHDEIFKGRAYSNPLHDSLDELLKITPG